MRFKDNCVVIRHKMCSLHRQGRVVTFIKMKTKNNVNFLFLQKITSRPLEATTIGKEVLELTTPRYSGLVVKSSWPSLLASVPNVSVES